MHLIFSKLFFLIISICGIFSASFVFKKIIKKKEFILLEVRSSCLRKYDKEDKEKFCLKIGVIMFKN